jgi:hypothetical protein
VKPRSKLRQRSRRRSGRGQYVKTHAVIQFRQPERYLCRLVFDLGANQAKAGRVARAKVVRAANKTASADPGRSEQNPPVQEPGDFVVKQTRATGVAMSDTNNLKREYARLQIDLENINSKLRETVDHLIKCDLVAFPRENTDPELSGAYHLLLKTTTEISEKLEMLQSLLSSDETSAADVSQA